MREALYKARANAGGQLAAVTMTRSSMEVTFTPSLANTTRV